MLQAPSVCLTSLPTHPAEMKQTQKLPFTCRVEERAAPRSCLNPDSMQGWQLLGAGEGGAATLQFAHARLGIKAITEMGIRFLEFFSKPAFPTFRDF